MRVNPSGGVPEHAVAARLGFPGQRGNGREPHFSIASSKTRLRYNSLQSVATPWRIATLLYPSPLATQQRSTHTNGRPLRADAERTVTTILEAAERTLGRNPAATMEQIAEAAGVARTTVHRRFATREVLIEALAEWATRQFAAAVDAAHPDTAPPLIALYQTTANVLRVKIGWGFAMSRTCSADLDPAGVHAEVRDTCERLFRRAQQAGLLRDDINVRWVRRVYYALIDEATQSRDEEDTDTLATLIVDTLLRGAGTPHPDPAMRSPHSADIVTHSAR